MLPGIYDAFQHWGEQTVWIYSDPHFSDEDLEYGIKNRPSDEEQIRRINAKAGRSIFSRPITSFEQQFTYLSPALGLLSGKWL